jgi:carbonic anhydrase
VVFLPGWLNLIPLSCLAAILLVTGVKLVSPALFKQIWSEGRYQFIPFVVTLISIVLTDLVVGVVIGLAVSLGFILHSNVRQPIRRIVEQHVGGGVLHIELSNQVSFLNRAALESILRTVPSGSHVLLDANQTDYIDPDVLSLIREFKEEIAPARGVRVSLQDFRDKYGLRDEIQFMDYTTRELQDQLTPAQVLDILREGNERFRSGQRLARNFGRQLHAAAQGQHPMAVVLGCIDSRTPSELIFDLGLGDIFSVRVAGNVTSPKVLGSMEYSCAVAGAKLILVVGHTRCGAVTAAVDLVGSLETAEQATGCQHLKPIISEIQQSLDPVAWKQLQEAPAEAKAAFVDEVARRNVQHSLRQVVEQSQTIRRLIDEGRIAVVGAMYDVGTGKIDYLLDEAIGLQKPGSTPTPSANPNASNIV